MKDVDLQERADLEGAIGRFILQGEGEFGSLLAQLARWQLAVNGAYRAFAGPGADFENWQNIPALPLSAFRDGTIFAFPEVEAVRTFRTSGTTGEGYGQHHFRTLGLYEAAARRGWTQAGIPDLSGYGLLASPREAPFSSLSCMAGWLLPEDRFRWPRWDGLIDELREPNEPCLLLGTALAFLDLFEKLGSAELALPSGSVCVETGGYKGTGRSMAKEDLYALFGEKLAVEPDSIWNEYGMTELSSQFYTRGLNRPHSGGPWVRGLVVDPVTGAEAREGEVGLLHIFDLANLDSCCALQTRDLAIRRGEDFDLIGRDPKAIPRGCSRAADSLLA